MAGAKGREGGSGNMSVDFDKEIAAITKRMRAAEDDYRHARLHDPGHPDTDRLRREIADAKRRIVELAEQKARARSADEMSPQSRAVFYGGNG
jgi:hypothetical protein